MQVPKRIVLLGIALVMSGCFGRILRGRDAVQRLLDQGDRLFALRADPPKLDEAINVWLQARDPAQGDPRVLERLVRGYLVRGYAHPEGTIDDLQTAREMGIQCLRLAPGFEGAVDAAGGVIEPRAILAIDGSSARCLAWTAAAWARWLDAHGAAGAAIDWPVVVLMAERARALAPDVPSGLLDGTLGLALTLHVPPEPSELIRAEGLLLSARRAAPGELVYAVDLAVHVFAARGDTARWRETLEQVRGMTLEDSRPETLENRQAQRQAQDALDVGMPDPSTWWR